MSTLIAWIDGRKAGEFSEERRAEGSLFAFEYDAAATASEFAVRRHRREIAGFDTLGAQMEKLWNSRIEEFRGSRQAPR